MKNTLLLYLLVFIFLACIVNAQEPTQDPKPATTAPSEPAVAQPTTPELTSADVGAFLDGFIPSQIRRDDIAGVVVVVIKDGSILFSKGYGYSDVKKKTPVTVDSTLFRPGSISKLFTWTAVMQQVEQGKLDLDQDVNKYLDFKIPEAFGKPITLRNIMTHSPGFEEVIKDLFVADAKKMPSLGEFIPTHVPKRIFPPGETPAYSNYGTALAGYIVERVTGKPFTQYLDDSIFKPLGMSRSTFVQPLPKNLEPFMSKGYRVASQDPVDFEVVAAYPAGSLSSTGADMARFIMAHLNYGRFENAQILKEETARQMYTRTLGLDEALSGMALGFYEENRNGLRIIGHGGDTLAFHSDSHIIHEKNVGFFISQNSAGKGEFSLRSVVWEQFLDRYFPARVDSAVKPQGGKNAKAVAGHYLISRRSESLFRLPYQLLQSKVAAEDDETIVIGDFKDLNGNPKKWKEIRPFVFKEVDGQDILVFKDKNGSRRLISAYPFMVWDSVPSYKSSTFLLFLIGFMLTIFLLTLILWPVAAIIRRHYGVRLDRTSQENRRRRLVRLIIFVDLLLILAYALFVVEGFENISVLSTQFDSVIRIFMVIAIIAAIATLYVIVVALRSWADPKRRIWGKLHDTAIAISGVIFLWILFAGHLLDFSVKY
jgi:CubicO group peptidase (beta-lactamase class C family)